MTAASFRTSSSRGLSLYSFPLAETGPSAQADQLAFLRSLATDGEQLGFDALWIPERHFTPFGGFYASPVVAVADLAARTSSLALRVGSVVAPFYQRDRLLEDLTTLDVLSDGRIGVSFATGWREAEFRRLAVDFESRRERTDAIVRHVTTNWGLIGTDAIGLPIVPVQPALPAWLTCVSSTESFRSAGEQGLGLFTPAFGSTLGDLAGRIATYREAGGGHVTVVAHAFVGEDEAEVGGQCTAALVDYFAAYLAQHADLEIPAVRLNALAKVGAMRQLTSTGLIGTVDTVAARMAHLFEIGTDEIACIVDFGLPSRVALDALPLLVESSCRARSR